MFASLVEQEPGAVDAGDRETAFGEFSRMPARSATQVEDFLSRRLGQRQNLIDFCRSRGKSLRRKHERIEIPPEALVFKPVVFGHLFGYDWLWRLFGARLQLRMGGQKTHAGIPAENGVVVSGGPQLFGFRKEIERLYDPVINCMAGISASGLVARPGSSLPHNAAVVGLVIWRRQPGGNGKSARIGSRVVDNLVAEREHQANQRPLVIRLAFQNVAADALGLRRLIQ